MGTTWANILWFQSGATIAVSPAEMEALATFLRNTWYDDLWKHFATSSCHFQVTHITLFLPASQKQRRTHVADGVGVAGSNGLPAQVSILLDWDTLDGRRGGKPRTYIAGIDQSMVDESYQVAASKLTAIQGYIDAFLGDIAAYSASPFNSLEFVEMSFYNGGAIRPSPVQFPLLGGHVRTVLATQRRRVDRQAA